MKIFLNLTFLLFLLANTIFAQNDSIIIDSNIIQTSKPIWIGKSFIHDQKDIWTSPIKIKPKDLVYIIPITILGTSCIIYDEEIHNNIIQIRDNNPFIKNLSPVLTNGGEITVVGGISAAFYLTGLVLKDNKAMQTGAIAGYALVNSAVVVSILKIIAGRQRPRVDATSHWYGFPESLNQFTGTSSDLYTSFPSGHSIAAWTLATVIAEQYKEIKVVPIIMYTLACGVALSRTTENAHWLSDAIVGSALGYGIGKYISKKHKYSNWVLFPSQNGGYITITGIYNFK